MQLLPGSRIPANPPKNPLMYLEWFLYGLGACGAFLVLFLFLPNLSRLRGRAARCVGGLLLIAALLSIVAVDAVWRPSQGMATQLPAPPDPVQREFVTSNQCRSCHPKEHESWHATYHRTMTQPARPESVLGSFDGRTLTSNYGATARVEKKGDEYWVSLEDLDLVREATQRGWDTAGRQESPWVSRQVVMTTGSHFFQAYWIRSERTGEFLQFPWRWHIKERRWMHSYDVFVGPEEDWTASGNGNYARVWNGSCTPCHTLGTVAGFDPLKNSFANTRVAELGISCESCHGQGGEHIRRHQDPLRRYERHLKAGKDDSIVNPPKCNSHVSSQICGQCHSHSEPVRDDSITGRTYRAGAEWSKHLNLDAPHKSQHWTWHFWSDGTERASGREFNGLALSACYLKGELSCSTCHSSHGGDRHHLMTPKMLTNQACVACHREHVENPQAHTHHAKDSVGSLCYNCHMPHTSLALLTAARSHRIDNPRVHPIAPDARPNACNLCHLNQSMGWTAERLKEWYGTAVPELSQEEQSMAAGALWLLRGDAGQRAVGAWHAGWEPAQRACGTDWLAPLMAPLIDDPYTAVRFIANKSVATLPGCAGWANEFDSTPARRKFCRQRLSEVWAKSTGRISPEKSLEPLFGANGLPVPDAINAIYRRRDNHSVRVEE